MTPEEQDAIHHFVRQEVTRSLIAEWSNQLHRGALTEEGLEYLRLRLRNPESMMLVPGPGLDFMLVRVEDALADMRGIDPADLPGSTRALPDTPEGLE